MLKTESYGTIRRQIERETDAEIAFGVLLEKAGVDCDVFMEQWKINRSQFNRISHYLNGLTEDISFLPPALAALLIASRQQRAA